MNLPIKSKQTAFDLFEENRKELLEYARWIALKLAKENNGYCTIDLVREQIKDLPRFKTLTVNPKVFGAVFKDKLWEHSGYKQTQRKEAHARPISIWKLKPDYLYQRSDDGQLSFVSN